MKYPKVSIIILNWNGWKDTIECLESLYRIKYPNYNVIVVDNGSKDKSIEKIKEYCKGKIKVNSNYIKYSNENKPILVQEYLSEEVEIIRKKERIRDDSSNKKLFIIKNTQNQGYAEGNNIGIKYALKSFNPDYILILNNDTVVDKDFLNELLKVAESDEKIGIVGAKVYCYDEPKKIESIGASFNFWKGGGRERGKNEIDKGQINKIAEVDILIGTVLLVKRIVLEQVGGLDPVYFVYWEETDWCIRIKKKVT